MVPTQQWMANKFNEYNTKYFGGSLPVPKFVIKPTTQIWGRYFVNAEYSERTRKITKIPNSGQLILTCAFDRAEKSIIGTMLHEMIHEYIYQVQRINPRNAHGREFMAIASKINADGWGISEKNPITKTDRRLNSNEAMQAQANAYNGGNSITSQEGDGSTESSQNEPSIIGMFYKPEGQDYKVFAFLSTQDGMNEQQSIIDAQRESLKERGIVSVKFYQCAANLNVNPSDCAAFKGVGANNMSELATNVANAVGGKREMFFPENMKLLKGLKL